MIVAIIQARMGSSRLPGKVLMDVGGVPLLRVMLDRVARSKKVDRIVVATSTLPIDDPIVDFCSTERVECFRGAENDVLSRYYECATNAGATTVVRLTGDCPLIDPAIIDDVVNLFERERVDYAANTVPPDTQTFPSGSDVEVFTYAALARANREVQDPHYREHVTFYFWREPGAGFKTAQLRGTKDLSKYRLSVDYPADIEVTRKIVAELFPVNPIATLEDITDFLEAHPEIYALNSMYYFGQGWGQK